MRVVAALTLVAAWGVVLAGTVAIAATCDSDCGDEGLRGGFVLFLLLTPGAIYGTQNLRAPRRERTWRLMGYGLGLGYAALALLVVFGWPLAALGPALVAAACFALARR